MLQREHAHTSVDVDHDLTRLLDSGPDALDVVVFQDIHSMGAPLALRPKTRARIFQMARDDLADQLNQRVNVATA